jgi:hypothetical protein
MKKFLFALRSIGLTIVGVGHRHVLVTTGLTPVSLRLFLDDPLPDGRTFTSGRLERVDRTIMDPLHGGKSFCQCTACSSRMALGLR